MPFKTSHIFPLFKPNNLLASFIDENSIPNNVSQIIVLSPFPVLFWDILLMGELFQNNHHHAGSKPNFAVKWYEFDPTYPIILFLDKIKVIKLVRVKK